MNTELYEKNNRAPRPVPLPARRGEGDAQRRVRGIFPVHLRFDRV
jgi:hypothetical protein